MMHRTLFVTLVLAVGLGAQDGADPFAAGNKLRRGAATGTRDVLPAFALKGFIEDKDGNAIALLEVEGKRTHLVRKGDALTLSRREGDLPLMITDVTHREIRIDIAGRKVVVR